jgi:hypothetical protein
VKNSSVLGQQQRLKVLLLFTGFSSLITATFLRAVPTW